MAWLEPFGVILLAALLSSVVGLEREIRGKPAGLRTNIVVAVAAAAFTYLSINGFPAAPGGVSDPGRIAAQIVSGIGFLGGGAIFASGGKPHGLTTAAALWGSAAVGVCVGAGQLPLAVALVTVTAMVLWPVDRITSRTLHRASRSHDLHLLLDELGALVTVRNAVVASGFEPRDVQVAQVGGSFQLQLRAHGPSGPLARLLNDLENSAGVTFVSAGSADADRP